MTTHTESLATLRANVAKLSQKDQDFANSMISQFDRRGHLSDKQWPWIEKLAEKSVAVAVLAPAIDVGNFKGVIDLFAKASEHLKCPRVVLALPPNNEMIVLNVATSMSSAPGSINIKMYERNPETGQRKWIGRVYPDGRLQPSNAPDAGPLVGPMTELLARFSKAPAEVASEHGRLLGLCCFCNKVLKDERSTSVGYGPVCARNFGMPW